MPELPEVEIVKKYLESNLIGKKIISFKVNVNKSIHGISPLNLKNQNIINVHRRGKNLIIETNNFFIIMHLRMEGKMFVEKRNNNHIHNIIELHFDDENVLYFDDFRKFATFHIFENKNQSFVDLDYFNKIGPEPWELEEKLMHKNLLKLKSAIKPQLLNQKHISGLGNIYVDEVLFECSILPTRISNQLSLDDCKCIKNKSIKIFNKAIEMGGTTIKTFSSNNKVGNYLNLLKIHLKPINSKCGTNGIVRKIKLNGRGTYYCEGEQK